MHYVRSTLVFLLLLHSILASAGDIAWRFGGSGYEQKTLMACDAAGNLYITGEFHFTTNWSILGGDSATSAGFSDIYVLKLNMAGTLQWSRTFGGTGYEYVHGIAVDAAGNICITGSFGSPSINFGGGARSRMGSNDLFVVKLDNNGNRVWDYTKGGVSAGVVGSGIGVNRSGQVSVSGYFTGTVDFGRGARSALGSDIFVIKLSSDSGICRADYVKGNTNVSTFQNTLKLDASGNVFIGGQNSTGHVGGASIDFGGGYRTFYNRQLFVLKLDSALVYTADYARQSDKDCIPQGMAVDTSGKIFITGYFEGTIAFSGPGGSVSCVGNADLFILKLNNALTYQWEYIKGGSGNLAGSAIEVDTPGNIYVTGRTDESIDFGGGTRTPWGSSNIFIVKLNGATAAHMASGLIGGDGSDYGQSVVVFRNYVYVSGEYSSTTSIDFDPGPGSYSPGPARGGSEAFIARLTNSTLALPVRLLEFSARREPVAGALLDWSAAEEEDIAAYMIERSTDGSAFQPVAAVPAANSPEITHNYTFTDPSAPTGLVYYRLRIAAVDGSINYSPVRALQGTTEAVDNRVYPTVLQAGGNVHVRYSGEQPQLTLCDAVGRVMQLTAEQAGSGLLMCTIPAQLQPGVYTLSLSSSQGVSSHRIVCR